MRVPPAVTTKMRQQLGVIARRQAIELGLHPSRVDRLVRSGLWEPVYAGVYRSAGAPETPAQRIAAACLATGSGVASHRTAAELWGASFAGPVPVEITVERERGWQLPDVILHRSRDVGPEQVTLHAGLPVTTPNRTLVDLGQVVSWREVQRVFDELRIARLVTFESARAALRLHSKRGRRGCGALRRVVEGWGPLDVPVESVLEAALLRLCRDAGLPLPKSQVEVVAGGVRRRLDFAYPALRIAIELDGYAHHSDRARFEDDRARRNALTLAGWTVLHFTWHQVVHRPELVTATIRQALANAA